MLPCVRLGLGGMPIGAKDRGVVVHRRDRVGMVFAHRPAAAVQSFLHQLLGLAAPVQPFEHSRVIVQRRQRQLVVGAVEATAKLERLPVKFFRRRRIGPGSPGRYQRL